MTVEEARLLNKGDYIFYKDMKYKVLHIKECRSAHTNEIYINIKCKRKNETLWLMNKFANSITEKEIQEHLSSAINTMKTTIVDYAKSAIIG